MPKRKPDSIPPLKRKREKNRADRAFVWLDGRSHYLGKWGSKASREAYNALIALWLSNGRKLPEGPEIVERVTVNDLIASYWRFCKTYYVKNGKPTDEQACIRGALKPLKQLYGETGVDEFTAPMLVEIQEKMVSDGNSRSYINKSVGRIRRCFKWGVKTGIVPGVTAYALQTVDGLKRGRTKAAEHEPVKPVDPGIIDATIEKCSSVVKAMIRFQLLTGCRPGELCVMRPKDIDCSNPECWIYEPTTHKTEHHGKKRRIYINTSAQALISRYMKRRLVFLTTRNKQFTTKNYRQRIWNACDRAKVDRWNPNQLRHNAATNIRAQSGVEIASVILGHSKIETTQIYAEQNERKAIDAIKDFGG